MIFFFPLGLPLQDYAPLLFSPRRWSVFLFPIRAHRLDQALHKYSFGFHVLTLFGLSPHTNAHTQMGLWNDNLVFTYNLFDPNFFVGPSVMVIKRSDLIAGVASPKFVAFSPMSTSYSSLLPGTVSLNRVYKAGGKGGRRVLVAQIEGPPFRLSRPP